MLLTFEDMTGLFQKAADSLGLAIHPEYWLNTRSLEREFLCTCHMGNCDDAERQSSCVLSCTWGALDTALSLDGPVGVCEFFHEPGQSCPHLHTGSIPPLIIDLSYSLNLRATPLPEKILLSLTQMLKLHASEHSRRTVDTSPGVSMVLRDGRLYPDVLNLQQRVEIPVWHPLGMRGLHDETRSIIVSSGTEEIVGDDPCPEEWLPAILLEVCQDIVHVLAALDAAISYNPSDC